MDLIDLVLDDVVVVVVVVLFIFLWVLDNDDNDDELLSGFCLLTIADWGRLWIRVLVLIELMLDLLLFELILIGLWLLIVDECILWVDDDDDNL